MSEASESLGLPVEPSAASALLLGTQIPYRVLAIDDSDDDRFLLQYAIRRQPQLLCLAALPGGKQALSFFRREPPYADRGEFPDPDIVLLDLKMPGIDGFAVLDFLRRQRRRQPFKVIVFTSSSSPADKDMCAALGADGFFTKPTEHNGYLEILRQMIDELDSQPGRNTLHL